MAITKPVYATREMVKRALDIKDTARANAQVDRLLEASSRSIDGMMHRVFYPRFATLKVSDPDSWLNDNELISATSVTVGGTPVAAYTLSPGSGPPFNRITADWALVLGTELIITGLFGYTRDLQSVGLLSVGMSSSSQVLTLPNGAPVGVGDLIIIGSEYILVTGRGWADSGQNLLSDLPASTATTGVPVTDGSAWFVGESILIDTEQCLIADIVGNTLIVKRAWDGTVLASHVGSDVYVSRSFAVTRGVVGSSFTSHAVSVSVSRWVPPLLITSLCIAETITAIQQEQSAYARVVGSGDSAFEAKGVGLADLRDKAMTAHGRKSRMRSV